MNVIYLTDGAARKIKIGNRIITFKKQTKKCSGVGEIMQSCHTGCCESIGKEKCNSRRDKAIQELLKKKSPQDWNIDIPPCPAWIRE